tara:strand:- start:33 stop:167 length:135 start_codon:yes stop_codon:yes gene_type:complete
MRKKQKHSNFVGSTQENDLGVVILVVIVGAIVYYSFKGVKSLLK